MICGFSVTKNRDSDWVVKTGNVVVYSSNSQSKAYDFLSNHIVPKNENPMEKQIELHNLCSQTLSKTKS